MTPNYLLNIPENSNYQFDKKQKFYNLLTLKLLQTCLTNVDIFKNIGNQTVDGHH